MCRLHLEKNFIKALDKLFLKYQDANALIICSSRKYDVSNALNEVLSKIKTQEKCNVTILQQEQWIVDEWFYGKS
jgi:hypothetical protein